MGRLLQGPNGRLVDQLLEIADLKRRNVFITSLIACRTPKDRDPNKKEMNTCASRLWNQIYLVDPSIIVGVGKLTCKALLKGNFSIQENHGIAHSLSVPGEAISYPVLLIPVLHPTFLLRQGAALEDGEAHRTAQHFDRLGSVLKNLKAVRNGEYPWKPSQT